MVSPGLLGNSTSENPRQPLLPCSPFPAPCASRTKGRSREQPPHTNERDQFRFKEPVIGEGGPRVGSQVSVLILNSSVPHLGKIYAARLPQFISEQRR